MAKKPNFDTKLGSWTDQANYSRPTNTPTPSVPSAPLPGRETHLLERGLIERIGSLSAANDLTPRQLIAHLLTWSLDQVETGKYKLPENSS